MLVWFLTEHTSFWLHLHRSCMNEWVYLLFCSVHFDWYHFYRKHVLIIYSSFMWYNLSYQFKIVKSGFLGVYYRFDKNAQTWWQKHCIFYVNKLLTQGLTLFFVGVFLFTHPAFCLVGSDFRSAPLPFFFLVLPSRTFCSCARRTLAVLLCSSLLCRSALWALSWTLPSSRNVPL